ncbi:hypothetical protein [Rhodovulum marinum]|uniref:Uncharacterized protein n=1 Tax=Rhodovulum marinum TaxID=320662 RepID=A0A4R2PT00_9RHOB|nr:hypothetical protein [Rhodovulum marinum]TCP38989.1 hypothetical protein EV662_11530 [Rhodovulum marinum]
MKDIAAIAPVPFAWTRGMVSGRAAGLMADLFPRARDAEPGECIGIVKQFVAFGRRSLTGRSATAMIIMGYGGQPVYLTGDALGTEGRHELRRLEELILRPGYLAFGALAPHAAALRAPGEASRTLELVLGAHVHMLRAVDWQTGVGVRMGEGQPISAALAGNVRLLAEHPGSPDVVSERLEVLYAEAGCLLKLLEFDTPVLPAMHAIAA